MLAKCSTLIFLNKICNLRIGRTNGKSIYKNGANVERHYFKDLLAIPDAFFDADHLRHDKSLQVYAREIEDNKSFSYCNSVVRTSSVQE